MKLAPTAICLFVASVIAGLPAIASAQLLVAPRRPGQSNVRYAEFDWRYVDILTQEKLELDVEWDRGPRMHMTPFEPPAPGSWAWPSLKDAPLAPAAVGDPVTLEAKGTGDGKESGKRRRPCTTRKNPRPGERVCPVTEILETAGGVRLYFYESERTLAERAAASIESSYRYLAEQFGYAPRKTFAYFLYGNYIEFLQTELFPIQEGVLGVTSTVSLELTLPYFGDHRMFEDVSTHELAHEFMLQKLVTVAKADGNDDQAALGAIPLWFVEGLAEYYAKRGLDPEAEVLVRDMVVNPTDEGYAMGSFFEERLTSGLWTYKVGQARCAFLEEVYGAGTLQRILEESPRLMRPQDRGGVSSFRKLVAQVTGEASSRIAARFERWIKRRAYASYMGTSQDRTDMGVIFEVTDIVQTLSASPSGSILMYRAIDPDTGAASLYLADRHEPEKTERVAMDGTPGVESLHPVAGRNFDLNDDILAFVAQSEGSDVIYVQHFEHESEPLPCATSGPRASTICEWSVDFDLGDRHALVLADLGIASVEAVALSPDGNRVAFIGLDASGQKDVWVTGDLRRDAGALVRVTHDVYGERDVAWGPRGVVYSSDATGHGKYNLFLADPRMQRPVERLTQEARDQLDPEMLPDGRVLFVAYDAAGANLYEVKPGGVIVRHTDVTTGLYDPSPGPDGSVWALHHQSHRRLPVRLVGSALRDQPVAQSAPDTPAVPLPRMSLLVDREYDPLALENWRPGALFVLAGFSGDAVFGSLIATASDRLQDHALVLTMSVFGSFDRTDADLTYINQENRVVWGAGIFHDVSARFDDTFLFDEQLRFISFQRFFGGTGIVRYPFDRFFYAQASLAVGGADFFVSDNTEELLRDPEQNDAGRDLLTPWQREHDGLRFRTETSFSIGYSTIGLHRSTGPIRGSALILSHTIGNEPFGDLAFHQTRIDGEHYIRLFGATNLLVRGAAGTTMGDRRAPQYFLSSFHTLRGVPFGDTDFLLGREFFYSTTELQFPIATLSNFPLIDLEGVLAADFGGAGDGMHDLWDRRVLDLVFGVNLGFAPIVIRLHFAQPIGIGAPLPNDGDLTFNFSLAWRY